MDTLEILERQQAIIRQLADLNEQLCAVLLQHQITLSPDLISESQALREKAEEYS